MTKRPLKLGFLASGNGSSALAIIDAVRAGLIPGEARLMVSNKKDAPALVRAAELGVAAICIPTIKAPEEADGRLAEEMVAHGVELIVLSGYLRRLGPVTLSRYAGRILNIHPGPLPQFGGEGMYGLRVHAAVLAARAAETGICVHVVDEEYDHGPVIARRSVPVAPGDTPESLQERVKALEPAFFVETLQKLAAGEIVL